MTPMINAKLRWIFFQSLLGPDLPNVAASSVQTVLDCIPQLVTSEDNANLLRPVTLEEVKEAVFLLNGDSCPGPDGFTWKFFFPKMLKNRFNVCSRGFFCRRPRTSKRG